MEIISQNRGNRFLTRPFFIQWLFLGIVLLCLAGIMSYYLAREHSSIEKQEQARLTNLAKVLDENIVQHLYAANRALVGIRDDLAYWKTKQGMKSLISQRLQTMSDAMPGIRTIAILNGTGTVVASNRKDLTGRNFAERDYFKIPHQHPSPGTLYLSPPFKTVLGAWAFGLSLPVFDHKGAFDGIVTATIDSEYFNTLLQSVLYAPDMRTSLNHGDGKVFLIVPGRKDVEGMDLAKPGSFYTRHVESKQTANLFKGLVYATGDERMMALRTIKSDKFIADKPLMVAVSRDLPAVFATWRGQAFRQSIVFGLLALAAVMSMYIYQWREKRFKSIEADHLAKIQENEERYRTVAEFTYAWEYWIGPDRRLIYTSPSCERITGYRAEAFMKDPDLIMAIVHPDDRDHIGHHMDDVASLGPELHESEFRILSPSGEVRWIAHVCQTVRAHDGTYLGRRASNRDITERKQADEALESSLSLLIASLESTADGMLIVDSRGKIVRWNDKFADMWKIPEEVLTSHDDEKAINHILSQLAKPAQFVSKVRELYEQPEESSFDQIEFLDGRVFERYSQPQRIGGKAVGRVWSFRDITERKRAEDDIHRVTTFLDSIVENIPDMIFIKDTKDLRFVRFNRAGEDLLGYSRTELLGKNDYDFFPKGQADFFTEKDRDVLRGKEIVDIPEESIQTRNKGCRILHTKKVPVMDSTGELNYLLGISEDITDRKRADDALRETNAYLENLINYANAPIIVWDPQFRITRFNHAFEFLTGRSEAEVIGQSIQILFPAALVEDSMALIRKTMTGERWETVEIKILHCDESVHTVLWNSATLFAPDDQTPIATIAQGQEITKRKLAEEALAEERRRLQKALDEIVTLRGIVPICSYCKKIRDDTGYWNQVEQYVSDHSGATFSHAICPVCLEKEMKELKS